MSWVTDWTSGIWSALWSIHPVRILFEEVIDVGGIIADALPEPMVQAMSDHVSAFAAQETEISPTVLAFAQVWNFSELAKIIIEPSQQVMRLTTMKFIHNYPLPADSVAPMAAWTPDHLDYVIRMSELTGQMRSVPFALKELTRTKLAFSEVRELYLRGQLDGTQTDIYLQEAGYPERVASFSLLEGEDDPIVTLKDRPDRERVKSLFQIVPDIQSIITMEMRDAFPIDPAIYPDEERTEAWQTWNQQTGAHIPQVEGWEPGSGRELLGALQEESVYGPQSYESWTLGARERYSGSFEAIARSKGLDPYWSMKLWESHWQLPGYAMLRELLYRSPMVTEQVMSDVLRWQDYPPAFTPEMVRVAYNPLTRVDVRRMHLRGVLSVGRVYQAYLAHGFNGRDASRMTAFTVVYNASSTYGGIVKEILESYSDGAMESFEAAASIWGLVAVEVPTSIPEWMQAEFTEEQIAAVTEVYPEIDSQIRGWIDTQLELASITRGLEIAKERLNTAKKQYVAWAWTEQRAREYLYGHGYSAARVSGLMERWAPLREQKERLPSRAMLEDFLVEQGMPVDTWRSYMSRLGYSNEIIIRMLEGVGQLPTRAMLESFYIMDVIGAAGFRDYMRRLGFDNRTIDLTIEALDKRK